MALDDALGIVAHEAAALGESLSQIHSLQERPFPSHEQLSQADCTAIPVAIIMNRGFIARWTRMPHLPGN